MSYFDEVYVKRMNKDGRNRQERVKTRKEKEFDKLFLKKSEYQCDIVEIDYEDSDIKGSLQPNKWNESELIGNLLISTSAVPLKTGNILRIIQTIKEVTFDKLWLVIFQEENITKGYQVFKCICLDEFINFTNEYGDTIEKVPVKIIDATSQVVKDLFSLIGEGYREPSYKRGFITADSDLFKKGTYFRFKDRGFEIYGKDNLSIKGVAYVYIDEKLYDEEERRDSEDLLVGEDTNFFLNGR